MIVLLLAALLSQPGPSADQAILATAGRIAARIPAHDDRLWTLASIAHKARDVGDVARAKHLVQLALTDLESLPETVAYDRVAPDLADVFELVAIADGCEHVDTWLADQIHRPFFSPAPNYLRVCAQGGFGARVEHLFRSVELTRDNAWLAAQAFVEGGALPTNAVVERFDAFFRLPDNDLSRRSRIDGEITVADQIGAGRACVGAMWRLQGDAAKALAWAKPFVAKPALVGNNGLFCLARAMPEPAVWMALARSIEHGTPYERAERFRRLAWGMRRQGAPDAELARAFMVRLDEARTLDELAPLGAVVIAFGIPEVQAAFVQRVRERPRDEAIVQVWWTLLHIADPSTLAALRASAVAVAPELERVERKLQQWGVPAARARARLLTSGTMSERVVIAERDTTTVHELAEAVLGMVGTTASYLEEAERDLLASLEGIAARRVAADLRAWQARRDGLRGKVLD